MNLTSALRNLTLVLLPTMGTRIDDIYSTPHLPNQLEGTFYLLIPTRKAQEGRAVNYFNSSIATNGQGTYTHWEGTHSCIQPLFKCVL